MKRIQRSIMFFSDAQGISILVLRQSLLRYWHMEQNHTITYSITMNEAKLSRESLQKVSKTMPFSTFLPVSSPPRHPLRPLKGTEMGTKVKERQYPSVLFIFMCFCQESSTRLFVVLKKQC